MKVEPNSKAMPSRQGFALILPATLAVMASVALAPTLPLMFKAFAAAPGAAWLVPMIITLPAVFLILTSPVAGWLGDRYGRRRLLIASLFFYAIFGLAPMLLDNLYLILADRALVGVAEAFGMTLSTTLIADSYTDEQRHRWIGVQVALSAVSAILFIAVGGFLGGFGWRASFAIYATPLLYMLLIARLTREPERPVRAFSAAVAFPWRAMARIWPVTLLGGVLFYTTQLESGVALHAIGFTEPRLIGLVLAGATIATVAGSFLFRRLVGTPTWRLLVLGFGLIGAGFLTISAANGLVVFALGLAVAQFGCGLLLPTTMTWAVNLLPFEVRGRGTGSWQGIFSFGQFLSPLIVTGLMAGMALNRLNLLTAFGLLGGVSLAAAIAILVLGRGGVPAVDKIAGMPAA